MMKPSALEALFRLQQIDVALAELAQKAQTSDEAAAVAQAEERLVRSEQRVEKAEVDLGKARILLRRLEMELQSIEESLQKNEGRLYGGEVTNSKELAGLQKRIDLDRRRKSGLEEDVLAAMEEVEESQAALEQAKSLTAAARERLDHARAVHAEAEAGWAKESDRLGKAKDDLRRSISSELLGLYDSLHGKMAGRPVAKVNERTCGGCHVELPTAMRKPGADQVHRCPNCGRLLWWP